MMHIERSTRYAVDFCFLTALAMIMVSCSSPSGPELEPEPEPKLTQIETTIPQLTQYKTANIHLQANNPDTLKELTLTETTPTGETNTYTATPNATRWDTTLTRTYNQPGTLDLELTIDTKHPEHTTEHWNQQPTIQPTPYVEEQTIHAHNFFTQEPVNGHLTLPGHRTFELTNGQTTITREDKIHADSLANGLYRILFEPENGYIENSRKLRPDENQEIHLDILPEEHGPWEWDVHERNLRTRDWDTPGIKFTYRWPGTPENPAEIAIYLYDERYGINCDEARGKCFREPTNEEEESWVAPEEFLADVEQVHQELDEMIPNVTFRYARESQEDVPDYGHQTDHLAIYHAGSPDVPFSLSRGFWFADEDFIETGNGRNQGGYVYNAVLDRKTPIGEQPPSLLGAVRIDAIENMGIAPGSNADVIKGPSDPNHREWEPRVPYMLQVWYSESRPAYSGVYDLEEFGTRGLANKEGGYTTLIRDYANSTGRRTP